MAKLETKTYYDPALKITEDARGGLTGYGAVFTHIDRKSEVVDKGSTLKYLEGFKNDGFIAVGHDHKSLAIGFLDDAYEDDHGLLISATFHGTATAQEARQTAMERLAAGKSVGLSIGYLTHKDEWRGRERHLKEIQVFETSLANIPMMPLAGIGSVKAMVADDSLPLAPLETDWDQARAEKSLIERFASKVATYVDGTANTDDATGYAWGYLPGSAQSWGVFKLPIADVQPDGSLRVIPLGVKSAADLVHNNWASLGIPDSEQIAVKGVLDSYFTKMRQEFGDDAPLPPWHEQKAENPLVGLTFDAHSETVLAAVKEYADRVEGLYHLRVTEKGKVNTALRDRIAALQAQIGPINEKMLNILADSEPKGVTVRAQNEFLRYIAISNGLEL